MPAMGNELCGGRLFNGERAPLGGLALALGQGSGIAAPSLFAACSLFFAGKAAVARTKEGDPFAAQGKSMPHSPIAVRNSLREAGAIILRK